MLTWEAKKEAIFEMPVRPRRRASRARETPTRERRRRRARLARGLDGDDSNAG